MVRLARQLGLRTAAVGSACQLVGLSWDALMHHLNPSLAEHEDVLTLANPSHAMFLLGLLITVSGLALELLSRRHQSPDRKGHRAAALWAAGLVTLSAGALTVAISTGGLLPGQRHSHTSGDGHDHELVSTSPALPGLLEALRSGGTEKALARLDEAASADQAVLGEAHNLAHDIGRASFAYYGSAPAAFAHCREDFLSGCYHGVLQAYMDSVPQITPSAIATLCGSLDQSDQRQVIRFQCLHGLGHGLYANLDNDLSRSLRLCDALGAQWDRESCYGGVFMENVNTALDERSGSTSRHTHQHASSPAAVRADDPLYPCDSLESRFLGSCFMMQSSVMLMLNGYDFPQAFRACDQAAGFVSICYQSLGRDISGVSRRDAVQAIDLCSLGSLPQRDFCFVGAAKDFAYETYRAPEGLAFCARLPDGSKPACYGGVGEQIYGFHITDDGRETDCAGAEPAYVDACRAGAQLTR